MSPSGPGCQPPPPSSSTLWGQGQESEDGPGKGGQLAKAIPRRTHLLPKELSLLSFKRQKKNPEKKYNPCSLQGREQSEYWDLILLLGQAGH